MFNHLIIPLKKNIVIIASIFVITMVGKSFVIYKTLANEVINSEQALDPDLAEYLKTQESIIFVKEQIRVLEHQNQHLEKKRLIQEESIAHTVRLLAALPYINSQIKKSCETFLNSSFHASTFICNSPSESIDACWQKWKTGLDPIENFLTLTNLLIEIAKSGFLIEHKISKTDDDTQITLLKVGNLALYYITPNGKECGIWSKQENSWKKLPYNYEDKIAKVIKLLSENALDHWIELPLPTATVAKNKGSTL